MARIVRVVREQNRVNTAICASCETKFPALLPDGRSTFCPACGTPQNENTKYEYNPEGRITDDHENPAFEVPQACCLACGQSRTGLESDEACSQCGYTPSPKAEEVEPEPVQYEAEPVQKMELQPIDWRKWLRYAGIGLVAAAVAWLVIWLGVKLLFTHDVSVTITGFAWKRNIPTEVSHEEFSEGWENSMPEDAIEISRVEKQNGYSTQKVGEEYGTEQIQATPRVIGKSEEYVCSTGAKPNPQVTTEQICQDDILEDNPPMIEVTTMPTPVYSGPTPVYMWWVKWKVIVWEHSRDFPSSGNDHIAWWDEDFTLRTNEREEGRTELYTVYITGDGAPTEFTTMLLQKWNAYPDIGASCTAKINGFGGINDLVCP